MNVNADTPGRIIRRFVLIALSTGASLIFLTPARADDVTTVISPIDVTFTDRTCAFPLTEHVVGQRVEIKRFDDDRVLTSWTRHVPLTATLTNPATGATATGHQAINIELDPTSPSPRTVSFAGLRFILTVPTLGVVLLDAGRVEFDADGEIVFSGGSHQLILGDVEGFCAFFAQ
jgi:hypothetical protein